jgi:hypothetical protein
MLPPPLAPIAVFAIYARLFLEHHPALLVDVAGPYLTNDLRSIAPLTMS